MHDFHCILGAQRARTLSASAVSQEALDLARVDPVKDVPCVVLMMAMPNCTHPGALLTFAEARRLADCLHQIVGGHGARFQFDDQPSRCDPAPAVAVPAEVPTAAPATEPVRVNGRLGPRLRELRQTDGLSQPGLARRVKCTPQMISHIERDHAIPSGALLARIAGVLGGSIAELTSLATQARADRNKRRYRR